MLITVSWLMLVSFQTFCNPVTAKLRFHGDTYCSCECYCYRGAASAKARALRQNTGPCRLQSQEFMLDDRRRVRACVPQDFEVSEDFGSCEMKGDYVEYRLDPTRVMKTETIVIDGETITNNRIGLIEFDRTKQKYCEPKTEHCSIAELLYRVMNDELNRDIGTVYGKFNANHFLDNCKSYLTAAARAGFDYVTLDGTYTEEYCKNEHRFSEDTVLVDYICNGYASLCKPWKAQTLLNLKSKFVRAIITKSTRT